MVVKCDECARVFDLPEEAINTPPNLCPRCWFELWENAGNAPRWTTNGRVEVLGDRDETKGGR